MPSYTGKILRVDLSGEECTIERNDELFYRRYMGGAVMGAYYLLREMSPGTDPFSPENIIVFATSVIVGAPAPGFCRYSIVSKSPLTGRIADTQAGGFWGPELKFTGFDAVVVKGRAKKPCYLWITDGKAEIRDASAVWGKTNGETLEYIRKIQKDEGIKVLSIGQAGENLVRYANVVNDLKHYNGRTGMGAVMGSKNLKALAVRGNGNIELDDPDTVKRHARWFAQNYKKNPCLKKYSEIGTSELVKSLNEVGMLPTRNFTMGYMENAEKIYGETMARTILQKTEGCFACPV
jgi:aldehyde:ferredoxin oxidoreductase